MIATLKRLAAEAAPSNPLVNPVLSGVAVTCVVGAAMDPALTQRVQYYPSHDVVARPQDLAVHGGRAVRGAGGSPIFRAIPITRPGGRSRRYSGRRIRSRSPNIT